MLRMPRHMKSLTGAASKIGEIGTGFLEDRLELLALEVQEVKIRLVQVILLVSACSVFAVFGLILLLCAAIYAIPPEWRLYALLLCAAFSILLGILALFLLRRVLRTAPIPFAETVQEIKKDVACFSTRN